LAGKRPRIAETRAAGGNHGGWQARCCSGPGIDRHPESLAAAEAEGSAGNVEREMVKDSLRRHMGKVTVAALELGVSRPTLYELMEKLGIARES